MKPYKIKIDNYKYAERYAKLSKQLDGNLQDDCEEYAIKFNNSFGEGSLSGINYDNGVSLQLNDTLFQEELEIEYDLGRRHPVVFLYVKKGYAELKSTGDSFKQKVSANEAIIFAPKGDFTYSILLPKQVNVQLAQVDIVRYLFLSKVECDLDTIPEALEEMFKDTIGSKVFTFKTSSDPASNNAVSNLFNNEQMGLERKLHLESYTIKLLTSLIKTFRLENDPSLHDFHFSKANIKLINQAKNYILENIHDTPTVKDLSLDLGMNTNKLQKGFQLLFKKSVRQFIISAKLHKAQQLLDIGDLNISEIVYKLGYTNKGHFSQLFRKEFGILPSEYIMNRRK